MLAPVFIKVNGNFLWMNSSPNSSNTCRPVSVMIEKESMALTREIYKRTLETINSIESQDAKRFLDLRGNPDVCISPKFIMIDGQACNHIFGNKDTQRCFVCHKRGEELSDFASNFRAISDERLTVGLKPLHSMLRIFEKLLTMRYKKGIFKFKRNEVEKGVFLWMQEQNKNILKTNKFAVHEMFWNSLKIDVDRPKQGFGTTTDGNCARIAFRNFEVTAKILEVNEGIVEAFSRLINLIYSKEQVQIEEYKSLSNEICDLWGKYLPNERLTPSIHLVLEHGPEILKNLDFRPGLFTEEGLEATHKEIRKTRSRFSRMRSREDNLQDLVKRLFINSHPFII